MQSDEKDEFELFVRGGQLRIIAVEETEHETISNMELTYSNRSFADKTALYKAIHMRCILLTCDDKLKKEAVKRDLEVYGEMADIINGITAIVMIIAAISFIAKLLE